VKSEEAAAVSTEIVSIVSEDAVLGTAAGLASDLALGVASGVGPDLPAVFKFKFNKLRLGPELAPRAAAPLEFDLELMLVSGVETNPPLDSAPEFAPVFSSVFFSVFSSLVSLTPAPTFASDWDVVAALAD
jgi:hypothetical protein